MTIRDEHNNHNNHNHDRNGNLCYKALLMFNISHSGGLHCVVLLLGLDWNWWARSGVRPRCRCRLMKYLV